MEENQRSLVDDANYLAGKYGGFSFGGREPKGVKPYKPLPQGTVFPNGAASAILLTFDVEGCYSNGTGNEAQEVANYKKICEKIQECDINSTFCVVGQMAEDYGPDFVNWMFDAGCEVITHGYWHDLNRVFDKDKNYAGHYKLDINWEQTKRGIDVINKIKPDSVKGVRLPYTCFNEYSYQVIQDLGLKWTSHLGIDDFVVPGQGFGGMPFQMQLGDKKYDVVEIPLDTQTYDWAIWVADEKSNQTFVDAVRKFCNSKNLEFERTPKGAVKIWQQRIRETIEKRSVFTLLCHPINLTLQSSKWDDAVEEFLFPVIEYLGELSKQNKVWVCTGSEMADFYKSKIVV